MLDLADRVGRDARKCVRRSRGVADVEDSGLEPGPSGDVEVRGVEEGLEGEEAASLEVSRLEATELHQSGSKAFSILSMTTSRPGY